jgi:hypothetical protein
VDGDIPIPGLILLFALLCTFSVTVLSFMALVVRRLFFGREYKLQRGNDPIRFLNRGTQLTKAITLAPGDYKITYRFDSITKVDLIEQSIGERETLLIKSGTGTMAFSAENKGCYVFEIEPQAEDSAWLIEISPLGLPSQE